LIASTGCFFAGRGCFEVDFTAAFFLYFFGATITLGRTGNTWPGFEFLFVGTATSGTLGSGFAGVRDSFRELAAGLRADVFDLGMFFLL
jgi:hypothetical protein